MDNYYHHELEEIYPYFQSNENGLTDEIILKNQKKYGKNELKEKEKKSKARVFLEQFQDMLVIILILCAIIAIFIGELESTIVIFFVITINACLGTYQYFKAEKSLDSLKMLSSPTSNVLRNGNMMVIPSKDLVCGDIVLVNAGDLISADGRIIEENGFEVNESALTGESSPVSKTSKTLRDEHIALADQKNMVFSGTFCTKGHAKYIVIHTGMNTEIGKIAQLIGEVENKKTPLQNSLDVFSKYLALLIILICFIVFILGIMRNVSVLDSLMFAVALAVAAIPEALSTIVVIVLAIGTEKMAKENAIIKNLKAVEGLGCVSVICSDKTGTLTMNQMEVRDIYTSLAIPVFKEHILYSTNYELYQMKNNNPTEQALIQYVGSTKNTFQEKKIGELPFSSSRKMMSNLYRIRHQTILYCKGAIEVILPKCQYIDEGAKRILKEEDQKKILNQVSEYAKTGKRVIAFAYKIINQEKRLTEEDENQLIFSGLVSLVDPPRPESKLAVEKCHQAGILPIMLTGDHKETAIAIAKEIGIYQNHQIALTGKELDEMNDEELYQKIDQITVYARLTPTHKIRIVKTWQKKKQIVAMTGDGINDAPALKQADISIAMGKMGTEVAKDASSIILTDDNFETIVKAVSNGRKVYENIQNAIRFLLSGNFAGILMVLFASIFYLPIPFVAVHLLFINLLTDSLPAIAIGAENSKNDLLNQPPRKSNEHFLNSSLLTKIILEGILIAICCFLSYYTGLKTSIGVARTMTFATLCMGRLFHSFNCSTKSSIFVSPSKNLLLYLSFIIGMVLINSVLFIPPLQSIFVVFPLTVKQIWTTYFYSLLPTLLIQLIKL